MTAAAETHPEREWMIDAGLSPADGLYAFNPVERDDNGEICAVVTGLTMLASEPPNGEPCIGVFHDEGEEAAIDFAEANRADLARFIPSYAS